jgi:hypothetical protein
MLDSANKVRCLVLEMADICNISDHATYTFNLVSLCGYIGDLRKLVPGLSVGFRRGVFSLLYNSDFSQMVRKYLLRIGSSATWLSKSIP